MLGWVEIRFQVKANGDKICYDDSNNVAGLRNIGAKISSGAILAFVDANCVVSKTWLKSAFLYFHNIAVVVWGALQYLPTTQLGFRRHGI